MSNCLTLTLDATSRNGQRQVWWPKCELPPPPGKLAAQLKSPFGGSNKTVHGEPLLICRMFVIVCFLASRVQNSRFSPSKSAKKSVKRTDRENVASTCRVPPNNPVGIDGSEFHLLDYCPAYLKH